MKQPAANQRFLVQLDALADPTRLRLLRLLERHELGVAELCEILQLPQSTISRHLKLLADQGWIAGRAEGAAHLYRMRPAELDAPARPLWKVARDETDSWPAVRQDHLRLQRRLRSRRETSRRFFAGAAGDWDSLRRRLYGDHFVVAALAALLPRDWVVADLGCGTGWLAAELAGSVRQVIGVDESAAMLAAARRRTRGLCNVELRAGDLEALPVDDGACDAALMMLALTYVADPRQALREAARILRPAGRVVVVDLLLHDRDDIRRELRAQWNGFEPAEIQSMLAEAGLPPNRLELLPPAAEARGPALFLVSAGPAVPRPRDAANQGDAP